MPIWLLTLWEGLTLQKILYALGGLAIITFLLWIWWLRHSVVVLQRVNIELKTQVAETEAQLAATKKDMADIIVVRDDVLKQKERLQKERDELKKKHLSGSTASLPELKRQANETTKDRLGCISKVLSNENPKHTDCVR